MKNYKLVGILAAGLVIVIGLLFWDSKQTKIDEAQKEGEKKLFVFEKGAVKSINYFSSLNTVGEDQDATGQKQETHLTMEKSDDGNWNLMSPIATRADNKVINDLLTTVTNYKYERILENSDNIAEYGLDKPARTIELRFADTEKKPIKILVGKKAPVGYSLYLKLEGEGSVYLGSQYFLVSTSKTMRDFRNKSLAEIDVPAVELVKYSKKTSADIEIQKQNDRFRITSPEDYAADQLAVEDFLRDINDAIVEDFIDQPSPEIREKFTDQNADIIVSWKSVEGDLKKLYMNKLDSGFLVSFTPEKVIYKMGKDFEAKMQKILFNFKDRRLFSFDSSNVSELALDGDKYTLENENWMKAAEDGKAVNVGLQVAEGIRSLLVDIEFAKADEFLHADDNRVKSLGAPKHHLVLTLKSEESLKTIGIDLWTSNNEDEQVFVKHTLSDAWFVTSDSILDNFDLEGQETPSPQAQSGGDALGTGG